MPPWAQESSVSPLSTGAVIKVKVKLSSHNKWASNAEQICPSFPSKGLEVNGLDWEGGSAPGPTSTILVFGHPLGILFICIVEAGS